MVEGGGEVLGSFLSARLVDEVALFRAPLLLGGRGSRPAFGGEDPKRIEQALRLRPSVPGPPAAPRPLLELWSPGDYPASSPRGESPQVVSRGDSFQNG